MQLPSKTQSGMKKLWLFQYFMLSLAAILFLHSSQSGRRQPGSDGITFDDVTEAFLDLCSGPESVSEETAKLLERFVILLYDKTSMCTSVNELRKELFTKGTLHRKDTANIWCASAT